MKTKLWVCSLIFLVFIPVVINAQTTLTARVDRQRVTLFETVTYTLTLESSSRGSSVPVPPDFNGFKVAGPPQTSSQFSWVNGKTTNVRSYTYLLEARSEGAFVLGPAKVVIDGKTIQSAPVKITVVKPEEAKAGAGGQNQTIPGLTMEQMGNTFIRAVVDEDTPFVGEPVRLSIYLYTRVNVRNYEVAESEYQGFWMENVQLPSQPKLINRIINGIEYGEAKLKELVLYPTVTGELTIPPTTVHLTVQSTQRSAQDDFFNSRFSMFNSRTINRSSQAMTINVKPLPVTGKPADFSGAVGDYKLTATIDNQKVRAGDAVVVRVSVSGENGLQTLQAPVPPELPEFKLYDPKSQDLEPDMQIPGNMLKTWEYILVPYKAGNYTIPPFSISFFDPETEQYRVTESDAFDLIVDNNPGATMIVSPGTDQEIIKLLNVDIRYIKTTEKLSVWKPLYLSGIFICSMIAPIFIVPVLIIINRRHSRLLGDSIYAREVKARSVSGKRFAQANEHLSNDRLEKALDDSAAAFARYLADRLGLPTGGVTLCEINQNLIDRNVDESLTNQIKHYWLELETARYAPVKPQRDVVTALLEKGQELVDSLEKVKIKRKSHSTGSRS